MRTSSLTRILLLIVFMPLSALAQTPQTYSDVREIEESGDVVGTELTVRVLGERVTGTIRHYEGADPEVITVTGRLLESALRLSGTYSEGTVEITARLEKDHVIGKLSFHLPGQTNEVELDLPRIERPRMKKSSKRRFDQLGDHPLFEQSTQRDRGSR